MTKENAERLASIIGGDVIMSIDDYSVVKYTDTMRLEINSYSWNIEGFRTDGTLAWLDGSDQDY